MKRDRNNRRLGQLWVSLTLSAAILAVASHFIPPLSGREIYSGLIWPLGQLMLVIAAGLVAGQTIEAAGWTRRLSSLARPLFRFSRLGDRCGAAFMTAFVSGVAANAMLQTYYSENKISREQLYLTNFINQLPAFFLHLPTTFFTVISMTRMAGVLYFALTFLAALLRTLVFLLYGRWRLPAPSAEAELAAAETARRQSMGWTGIRRSLWEKIPSSLLRIGVVIAPVYTAVFVINRAGLFTAARDWLADAVVTTFVPMESLSIVVLSFVAEFTSGFAAAGALMDAGMLTTSQTVLALLAGNVLAFPIRAVRHQLPHYLGIFPPRTGAALLIFGQLSRVVSLVAVGAMFYMLAA